MQAFFWDPLGDAPCADAEAPLADLSVGRLYGTLAVAALHHPLAYAAQRLAYLNSTERWLVPTGWPDAWPPDVAEANAIGLANPAPPGRWVIDRTTPLAETPLAWPIVWIALAVAMLIAARRRRSPRHAVAMALLVSALSLEASFAVIGIASDLRYHLWPMMATALASVLVLADRRPSRRAVTVAGAAVAVVVASGAAARMILPPAPTTYQAMLTY